jgi:ketosteroid isomerase-like protein
MRSKTLTSLFTLSLIVPLTLACARDADETVPAAEPAEVPAADAAAMPQQLAGRIDQYTAAWNGSNTAAVAEFFTDDATARVGDDTFTGRQEIEGGWLQNVPNINDLDIRETLTEQRGQDYYMEGTYTHAPFQTEEGVSGTSGRFTVTWTQAADGQWRIRSTEVMPDAPPQP